MDDQRKSFVLDQLIHLLASERSLDIQALKRQRSKWDVFRALVNTRPAVSASKQLLQLQDELLQALLEEKPIASLEDTLSVCCDARMRLWQGDITILQVGAIVNAANAQMLGCWQPGHYCIDNAIHTYAGIQLRLACAELMQEQGHLEETGSAKITPGFNLPSHYVIHTVGPIASGRPTAQDRTLLASCYRSCLDLALEAGVTSVAFCCISTGVFGFPQDEAADIATRTVKQWLDAHPSAEMTVVFNVFLDRDFTLYRERLGFPESSSTNIC